ncbi:GTP-binding protein [Nocardiopsis sp. ARC36]
MAPGGPIRVLVVSGIHENARRDVIRSLRAAAPDSTHLRFDPARPAPSANGGLWIVEAPGGLDPALALESLTAHASPRAETAAVVTAVDAHRCLADLVSEEPARTRGLRAAEDDPSTVAEALLRQIDYADHLALVGVDRAGRRGRPCRSLLNHLNPAARVLTDPGPADLVPLLERRFDGMRAAARLAPAFPPVPPQADEEFAVTVVWRRFRPLHPGRFLEALDEITDAGVRSRGRLWLASLPDTMLTWEAVGPSVSVGRGGPWLAALPEPVRSLAAGLYSPRTVLEWHPRTGDRCQHIAFTGLGEDSAHPLAILDSCLLSGAEDAAWREHGPPCEDPSAPLPGDGIEQQGP